MLGRSKRFSQKGIAEGIGKGWQKIALMNQYCFLANNH